MIIELLLSMVFKSSKNIAKLVLTALADHMTPKAFQLIVDVRNCKLEKKNLREVFFSRIAL